MFAVILKTTAVVAALAAVASGLLYLLAPKPPRPPRAVAQLGALESYLEQSAARQTPPGFSLAVVNDGRLVYSRGFGWADGPRGLPATQATVYHWWSMTKIPTAIAVLQLQEQGRLTLDDPVEKYVPFFRVKYPGHDHPVISVRQLLNHTSGLRDNVPEILGWVHREGDPSRNQTELLREKLPAYAHLAYTPGERTQYSNVGYMALGAVIESASGMSYEDFVRENILKPLKMDCTDFVVTAGMVPDEAAGSQHLVSAFTPLMVPYIDTRLLVRRRDGMRLWFNRIYNDQTPPTGLIGPVTDVARLMLAVLNGGELDGARILSAESTALMLEAPFPMGGGSYQGLGWRIHTDPQGRKYLEHAGAGPGFHTGFRVYPEQRLGLVVMGNDTAFPSETMLDLAAGLDWTGKP